MIWLEEELLGEQNKDRLYKKIRKILGRCK